jgi:hypothetical protein
MKLTSFGVVQLPPLGTSLAERVKALAAQEIDFDLPARLFFQHSSMVIRHEGERHLWLWPLHVRTECQKLPQLYANLGGYQAAAIEDFLAVAKKKLRHLSSTAVVICPGGRHTSPNIGQGLATPFLIFQDGKAPFVRLASDGTVFGVDRKANKTPVKVSYYILLVAT